MTVNYRFKQTSRRLFCIQGRPALRGGTGNAILCFDPENPTQKLFPAFLHEPLDKGLCILFHDGIDLF